MRPVVAAFLSASSWSVATAQLVVLEYNAIWSSGGGVTASGTITFKSTVNDYNPGSGPYSGSISGLISSLSLTVSGDAISSYNGSFTFGDYSDAIWNTGGSQLNSNLDLRPQFGSGGDFALISSNPNAPDADPGSPAFTLKTGSGSGTLLTLQSMSAVPEPEEWAALTSIGLFAFGLWHRKSKNKLPG